MTGFNSSVGGGVGVGVSGGSVKNESSLSNSATTASSSSKVVARLKTALSENAENNWPESSHQRKLVLSMPSTKSNPPSPQPNHSSSSSSFTTTPTTTLINNNYYSPPHQLSYLDKNNKQALQLQHTVHNQTGSSASKKVVVVKKKSETTTTRQASRQVRVEKFEETPLLQAFFTFLSYTILQIFGHFREFLRSIGIDKRKGAIDNNSQDFVPLYQSFESFFTRNYYLRVRDVFNRPICSVPGAEIELLERKSDDYNWSYYFTGRRIKALNFGSYNYLGFAENSGPSSKEAAAAIATCGIATSSSCAELGTLKCHRTLENLIARFLNVEDAIIFGMGFATNALNIPTLMGDKQSLIISDELNHSSIILGARLSGATIKTFKHNDVGSLEKVLRGSIIEGHPKTRRPWKKILILVEGVYRYIIRPESSP